MLYPAALARHKLLSGGVAASVVALTLIYRSRQNAQRQAAAAAAAAAAASTEVVPKQTDRFAERRNRKVFVDRAFFRKLRRLIVIAIPSLKCKEVGLLIILTAFLVGRTFLSIKISQVNGGIVKSIVERKFGEFLKRIGFLAAVAIPASFVNSLLKYLDDKLAQCFRIRLQAHFHDEYMKPLMSYKVSNLDNRISNPDHLLTESIDKWSKSLSSLYSNVSKPILDIVLFSAKLSELLGPLGPTTVILYYISTGLLMRIISPAFGKLTAVAQQLEGEFRFVHNRLITHSEEIAFYGGHRYEKRTVNNKFANIVKHMNNVFNKHLYMGVFDGFLVKYGAVMTGYAVLGLPVFGPQAHQYAQQVGSDTSMITRDYIRNSGMLINLAKAIGRIVTSYKEVQTLAGYTSLVSELQSVLSDLKNGKYNRVMVADGSNGNQLPQNLFPGAGEIIESTDIRFEHVPIVTPNGDLLVEDLTFQVQQNMNLMITGPNGCGKSSLFRILGELWPLFGGKLYKPKATEIFYIPQRPYLAIGTLRDQVIYPDSFHDMQRKGLTDDDLLQLLQQVKLEYIVGREGGWNAVNVWEDVLSGGEKQRVAMARVFYHRPRFAILDECTSAVSVDVEGFMYTHCRQLGIALITVSHRPSLIKYHEYLLKFDGRGHTSFRHLQHEPGQDYTAFPE